MENFTEYQYIIYLALFENELNFKQLIINRIKQYSREVKTFSVNLKQSNHYLTLWTSIDQKFKNVNPADDTDESINNFLNNLTQKEAAEIVENIEDGDLYGIIILDDESIETLTV